MAISNAHFGDNIVFFRSEANRKDIQGIRYDGKKRDFDFDDYVMRHVTLHNNRSALVNRAEDQGVEIHAFLEYDKGSYLLSGIQDKSLDACTNAIIADGDGIRKNFDLAVRHIRD